MENIVRFIHEKKEGNTYIVTYECTDEKTVYTDLARELINKKINCCTYIRSIRREPLFNGYQKIIVIYNNNVRRTYTILDH